MVEKISVILPVYNERESVKGIIDKIFDVMKTVAPFEIIVVDDGSTDDTSDLIKDMVGIRLIRHPQNIGNGAAVKTGIRNASGDIVVLMDADGQHNPADIPQLLKFIPQYDMVVGARIGKSKGAYHRRFANTIYNIFASYLTQTKILDLTSGFRVIKKDVVKNFLYLLPNTFSYPTTITLAVLKAGFSVKYQPIELSLGLSKSKIKLFSDGARFFAIMLRMAVLFKPLRVFLPISLFLFASGFIYGVYIFYLYHQFSNLTMFFILTSILVFLMGLISEQIVSLRFEKGNC